MTTVIFRMYLGKCVALFPYLVADSRGLYCQSYCHTGQHGAAEYNYVVSKSSPATEAEYADLLAELKAIGYQNLEIRRMINWKTYQKETAKQ